MNIVKVFLAMTTVVSFVSAGEWDCDPRCDEEYDICMRGGNRRELEPLQEETPFEEEPRLIDVDALVAKASLRGETERDHQHRRLSQRFKLKMYHEEGFCWQGEWDDPEWCMECAGSTCSEREKLEIGKCNTNDDDDQFFVYEPLQGTGGGRLKPYEKQDLCLMRTTDRQHTLEKCDDVNQGVNNRQILLGLEVGGVFQLRPLSRNDHCLTQHHHPRSGETIYADVCKDACDDNACLWETINVKT